MDPETMYTELAASEDGDGEAERRRRRRYYVTMATLNFFETGAGAGLTKFFPVFLASRGLDTAQVGAVLALMQVGKFLGGLVFGRAADATGAYRGVLLWTNGASIALAVSMTSLGAPWRPFHGIARVAIVAVFASLQSFFASSSGTLIDAIAVVNQSSGAGADYGSLRLWAACGWGVAALAIGGCVDAFGFSSIFIAYAAGTCFASLVVVFAFSNPERAPPTGAGAAEDRGGLRGAFLGNCVVPLYFLNFFLHGLLAAFVESFLLLYAASRYPDAPSWFLGAMVLESALCEVPVFLYASAVLKRYGVRRCLVFAQLLFAARCLAYAYLPAVAGESNTHGYYLFLALEPSHAITFAMMWSAAVDYARITAPPRHQGAAQALLRGVYYYVGIGVGSYVGGRVVKAYGFQVLYKAGGAAMVGWAALWAVLLHCAAARDARQKAPPDPDLLLHDSADFI